MPQIGISVPGDFRCAYSMRYLCVEEPDCDAAETCMTQTADGQRLVAQMLYIDDME